MRFFHGPVVSLLAFSLAGCIGTAADETDGPVGSVEQAQGGGNLQIATTSGLFVIDHPASGEPSVVGMVLVMAGHAYPPADTIVTINGVRLSGPIPGLAPRYWQVDPAGPQPVVGADGFLHLSATSSAGSRALDLPCPPIVAVTTDPAAGASLAGLTTLTQSWTDALPAYASTEAAFGIAPPNATVRGYSAETNALGQVTGFQYAVATAPGSITLGVSATPSSGFLSELRYPGAYLLDGNSGGACGRAVRTFFTN